MIDNHAQTFIEEAFELLSDLEAALLELEENPSDTELIGRVFRALHTIKGSGAMFGFDNVAQFTHKIETVFDDVREGKLPVTEELVSLTLKARDLIRLMIEAPSDEASLPQDTQTLIDSFAALDGGNSNKPPPKTQTQIHRRKRLRRHPNRDRSARTGNGSPPRRTNTLQGRTSKNPHHPPPPPPSHPRIPSHPPSF
jgi:chemotaxis protein histidine kinase CheA